MARSGTFLAISFFAVIAGAAIAAFADDGRRGYGHMYGYGWHMGPGHDHMGPGYGRMGPGYGHMGPGYGHMGPGYGHMGPGYGPMRGIAPRGRMGGYGFRGGLIDANDDGIIGDAEASRHFERRFLFLDADGDGALTEAEYLRFRPPFWAGDQDALEKAGKRYAERLKSMDANKDGNVDKGEYMSFHRKQFSAADSNKDGKVDVWEYRSQHRR